jgi:hypothetical protein
MGVPSSQVGGPQPFYRKVALKSSGANPSPQYEDKEILREETIIVRVGINCCCDDIEIYIPGWVEDVASFLSWSKSGGIPEGRVLGGSKGMLGSRWVSNRSPLTGL